MKSTRCRCLRQLELSCDSLPLSAWLYLDAIIHRILCYASSMKAVIQCARCFSRLLRPVLRPPNGQQAARWAFSVPHYISLLRRLKLYEYEVIIRFRPLQDRFRSHHILPTQG